MNVAALTLDDAIRRNSRRLAMAAANTETRLPGWVRHKRQAADWSDRLAESETLAFAATALLS